jgi:hypothetical protein
VAIRVTNWHLSQQFISESPLLPPFLPQENCHPERQRGISFSNTSTIKNGPSKNIHSEASNKFGKETRTFYQMNYLTLMIFLRDTVLPSDVIPCMLII